MKKIPKFVIIILGIIVAVVSTTSCTQKMCPTYGYHAKK
jgi:uncharacterized protein YpmB